MKTQRSSARTSLPVYQFESFSVFQPQPSTVSVGRYWPLAAPAPAYRRVGVSGIARWASDIRRGPRSGSPTFARQARHAGAERLIHISGLGADPTSDSPYIGFWLLSGQIEPVLIFAGLSVADLFLYWSRIGPILDGSE